MLLFSPSQVRIAIVYVCFSSVICILMKMADGRFVKFHHALLSKAAPLEHSLADIPVAWEVW